MKHLDNDYKLNLPRNHSNVSGLQDLVDSSNPTSYKIIEIHAHRDADIYGNIIISNPCMINKSFLGLN